MHSRYKTFISARIFAHSHFLPLYFTRKYLILKEKQVVALFSPIRKKCADSGLRDALRR